MKKIILMSITLAGLLYASDVQDLTRATVKLIQTQSDFSARLDSNDINEKKISEEQTHNLELITQNTKNIDTVNGVLIDVKAKLSNHDSKLASIDGNVSSNLTLINANKDQIDKSMKMHEMTSKSLDDVSKLANTNSLKINELSTTLGTSVKNITDMNETISNLQINLQNLMGTSSLLSTKTTDADSKFNVIQSSVTELNATTTKNSIEIASVKDMLSTYLANNSKEGQVKIDNLSKQNTSLESDLNASKVKLIESQQIITDLTAKLSELGKKVDLILSKEADNEKIPVDKSAKLTPAEEKALDKYLHGN